MKADKKNRKLHKLLKQYGSCHFQKFKANIEIFI